MKNLGVVDDEAFGHLTPAYDAATKRLGGNWRTPDVEDVLELMDECTWSWITINGVDGYNVVGNNGNSIFLPAAGYKSGNNLYSANTFGWYWTSEFKWNMGKIRIIYFSGSGYNWPLWDGGHMGLTIRAVSGQREEE